MPFRAQRRRGTEAFMPFRVQRDRGTEGQRRRGTKAQRRRGTKAQRFFNAECRKQNDRKILEGVKTQS